MFSYLSFAKFGLCGDRTTQGLHRVRARVLVQNWGAPGTIVISIGDVLSGDIAQFVLSPKDLTGIQKSYLLHT